MTKKSYVGIVILALLVGLFIGYCVLAPTWSVPSQFKYDILKDTLTIVLAVLAVGIAVISYTIYQILSGKLAAESAIIASSETLKESARAFVEIGFVFWKSYDEMSNEENQYIEIAITLTEHALFIFNRIPDREAKNRENDKLLCNIKNNLAYYYAIRNKPRDCDTAKEYAEYIYEKMSKYGKEKDNWLDTYTFVYRQCGS